MINYYCYYIYVYIRKFCQKLKNRLENVKPNYSSINSILLEDKIYYIIRIYIIFLIYFPITNISWQKMTFCLRFVRILTNILFYWPYKSLIT